MNKINLNVLRGPDFKDTLSKKNEIPYFIGYISAKDLVDNHKIPYSSIEKGSDGYQRQPGRARIAAFAKKISAKPIDFPTLILLNIRDEDQINFYKNGVLTFMPDYNNKLFVVDGQHRVLALKIALDMADADGNNDLYNRISNIQIPFGLTITESVLNEMVLFYEVNNFAKSVSANIRTQIETMRAKLGDEDMRLTMEQLGDDWKMIADHILLTVTKDYDSVWFNRIKYDNTNPDKPNVGNFAMTKYLKNIIASNEAEMASDGKTTFSLAVFNAYWKAFEIACPSAFGEDNARKYSIQTAMGADVFMRMWAFVKDWIVRTGQKEQDLRNPETYVPAFKKIIKNSEGIDREGNIQEGLDYWLVGSAAGAQGSGEAGKSQLVSNLKQWLTLDE